MAHAEAIEADFQRYYNVHVGLLGCEELTYRRFRTLLFHLPREALFMQATLGAPAKWSTTDYLIANVIDAVTGVRHLFQRIYRKKGHPIPDWEPFPRPGVARRTTKTVMGRGDGISPDEMRKFLDDRRRGGVTDG